MIRSTRILTRSLGRSVATAFAVGCLAAGASACAIPSGSVPGLPALPALSGATPTKLELPADLCAAVPVDKILAATGLPGPGFSAMPISEQVEGHSVRGCSYAWSRGSLLVAIGKSTSRAEFDAGRAAVASQGRVSIGSDSVPLEVADLPIADTAYSVTSELPGHDGRAPIRSVTVVALAGDMKIHISSENASPEQLGAVVTLIIKEPWR